MFLLYKDKSDCLVKQKVALFGLPRPEELRATILDFQQLNGIPAETHCMLIQDILDNGNKSVARIPDNPCAGFDWSI